MLQCTIRSKQSSTLQHRQVACYDDLQITNAKRCTAARQVGDSNLFLRVNCTEICSTYVLAIASRQESPLEYGSSSSISGHFLYTSLLQAMLPAMKGHGLEPQTTIFPFASLCLSEACPWVYDAALERQICNTKFGSKYQDSTSFSGSTTSLKGCILFP